MIDESEWDMTWYYEGESCEVWESFGFLSDIHTEITKQDESLTSSFLMIVFVVLFWLLLLHLCRILRQRRHS